MPALFYLAFKVRFFSVAVLNACYVERFVFFYFSVESQILKVNKTKCHNRWKPRILTRGLVRMGATGASAPSEL